MAKGMWTPNITCICECWTSHSKATGVNTFLYQPPLFWEGFPWDFGKTVAGFYPHSATTALQRSGTDVGRQAWLIVFKFTPKVLYGMRSWLYEHKSSSSTAENLYEFFMNSWLCAQGQQFAEKGEGLFSPNIIVCCSTKININYIGIWTKMYLNWSRVSPYFWPYRIACFRPSVSTATSGLL